MKQAFLILSAMIVLLIESSCKKAASPAIDPELTAKWDWVYSGSGRDTVIGPSSGVQKTLLFESDGTLIIDHNDSTASNNVLPVAPQVVLLAASISDTFSYQIISESAGCVDIRYPALLIKGQYGYQYTVSNDTLQVSAGPCVAPYAAYFVKAK